MPIVALKCPKCGGNITLDDSREIGKCDYCGMTIVLESTQEKNEKNYTSMATAEFKVGNSSTALKYAKEALLQNDTDAKAWAIRGLSELDLAVDSDDYKPCTESFRRMLYLSPGKAQEVCDSISKEFDGCYSRGLGFLMSSGDRYYYNLIIGFQNKETELFHNISDESTTKSTIDAHIEKRMGVSETNSKSHLEKGLESLRALTKGYLYVPYDCNIELVMAIRKSPDKQKTIDELVPTMMEVFSNIASTCVDPQTSENYHMEDVRRCLYYLSEDLESECKRCGCEEQYSSTLNSVARKMATDAELLMRKSPDNWPEYRAEICKAVGDEILSGTVLYDYDRITKYIETATSDISSKWGLSLRSMFKNNNKVDRSDVYAVKERIATLGHKIR